MVIVRLLLAFSYAPDTGGVSVNIVYGISHLAETGKLYTNPEEPPFAIIQYTPFHYYTVYHLACLMGIEHNVYGLLVVNRLFCLTLSLLYCILLGFATLRLYPGIGRQIATTLAAIAFAIIPNINFARIDNLYLFFFILSIFAFIRHLRGQSESPAMAHRYLIIAAVASGCAMLTKQIAISSIVMMSGWLLLAERNLRSTLLYCLATAITISLGIAVLIPHNDLLTFKLNVVDGLKNGVNLGWFYYIIIRYYFFRFGIYAAFGIYIAVLLLKHKNNLEHQFLGLAALWFFCTATILGLKDGSGPNYYLEFTYITIINCCVLLQMKPTRWDRFLPLMVCWLPVFIYSNANDKGWSILQKSAALKQDYENTQKIAAYVNKEILPGHFVLTAFHRENCLNISLSKSVLFPCREVALTYTRPLGIFHFYKFDTLMNSGAVQFYVNRTEQTPHAYLNNSLVKFSKDTTIGAYTVYRYSKD